MKIDHVAMYVRDLEVVKDFWLTSKTLCLAKDQR